MSGAPHKKQTFAPSDQLKAASARQNRASDPVGSVWVGASAGAGKTKVLIDRTLRLMLPRPGQGAESATRPEKILCLTFTKTAAAEMSNRIYERLGEWAVMDDDDLRAKIEDLIEAPADEDTVHAARRLFAHVLDTPGGLKIMTIHSFCQSVLKRFPVEAGLAPHFEMMDEASAVEYLTRCLHDIIADARRDPESPVADAFNLLALHLDSATMSELMSKIMAKRSQLQEILRRHGDGEGQADQAIAALYARLGVSPEESEEKLLAAAGHIPPAQEEDLRRALRALLEAPSAVNSGKAEAMQPWLEQPQNRAGLFFTYCNAFLTEHKKISGRPPTKAAQEVFPDILDIMTREGERLLGILDRLRAVRLAAVNAALLRVSAQMIGRYAGYKRRTDRLDFDDLIIKACELLADSAAVQWVLFKLDEGIDHILVDEAQDTSPYQWQVVRSLAVEFFSGLGRTEDRRRTLFVVGDEKQSIFSFQGADPAEFSRMRDFFGARVRAVQDGWEILMDFSFRSTAAVLETVDRTFAVTETRRGVVADIGREVRHSPIRLGHAGLIEMWPLIEPQQKEEKESWRAPLAVEGGDSPMVALAQKIAATIAGWLSPDKPEMLPSRGRPVRPGDIMILVQSRGAFVEAIMRALKEANVPVAGIDRMRLGEEIAVMDLIALAQFALLPRDDLTLATVLRSPFVNMTEDELYNVCKGRRGTLWAQLQDVRPDVSKWLRRWIERTGHATPYEFFIEALHIACPADAISGRRALFSRLGLDIEDALEEFLGGALNYEQTHIPSLQRFIDWFQRGQTDIKREQEPGKNDLVRIMTVHASKGLQAPIVFLPDTTKKFFDHNKGRVRLLWPSEAEGAADGLDVPLWSPRKEFDTDYYTGLREEAVQLQEEEYRRLLYVALTRAEDRLYIAGYRGQKKEKQDCWYNLVSPAFDGAATHPFVLQDGEQHPLPLHRVVHPQTAPPRPDSQDAAIKLQAEALPDWAAAAPAPEPTPAAPLTPSKPDDAEPAARSPLAEDETFRFQRGNILHRILETLPQLPSERRDAALTAYLSRPAFGLAPEKQAAFADEIRAVLNDPAFAPIFGPGSRAEVPLVGLTGAGKTKILSGQIDRLRVTANEVLVVDFKTNRPPPMREEDVPVLYLRQLAAYKSVLLGIYPGKAIKCALLWTDAPRLMPVSDKLLDRHMP